ncbi:MAG: UDP-glucose/GDP-mannose dehydrogenase family protein [Deltaproteobacteria bacterium]|nr:UDP-glucose/GDP-mannose dehydrogenase family protein [Deltaproteobacteria bacterium]
MKICVMGTGYVGLVAGTCFAENGSDVICVDVNKDKIDGLNRGQIPIYEPGLTDLVTRNTREGRLAFTTDGPAAIRKSDIIFLAIGTPSSVDGSADLSMFLKAAEVIADNLNGYKIIVNKSTVPVGTAAKVEKLVKGRTKQDFDVVSNPEFLKEGTAIDDFLKPDRVVIGTAKESVYKTMAQLYAPFVRQGNPIIWMSNVSAEITKYAANSFLATKISFINEIANLCELAGADIESVRKGITTDVRIGKHFLYRGAGYGGSCFPKDVKALLKTGQEHGLKLEIIEAAEDVNERQKSVLFHKIDRHFDRDLKGRTIAVWGLSFKPNTDDMREAPSVVIIEKLCKAGARIHAYDPVAVKEARHHIPKDLPVTYFENMYEAIKGADALAVVTEWNEFRNPDFARVKSLLKHPVVFDGRNVYSPERMQELGFTYQAIGRQVGGPDRRSR